MDNESLIVSVKSRGPLWDQKLKEHHNRYVLDRLWKEVAKENKCTVKVAQSKWKGMRDYYRKEIRREAECEKDEHFKSYWPYFTSLEFIKDQFILRTNSRKVSECEYDDSITCQIGLAEYNEDIKDGLKNIFVAQNKITTSKVNDNSQKLVCSNQDDDSSHSTCSSSKKFRSDNLEKEKTKVVVLEENQSANQSDDDVKFFESLLPYTKQISGVNKLLFRNEVQSLVIKYAFQNKE